MKATTLSMLVCLLLTPGVSTQVPTTPKVLVPSSVRSVAAPPFGFYGTPDCDNDGNMYFHAARSFNDTEIFRLSADGNEGKVFKVADQFPEAAKFGFLNFSVTPGGNIYVLGGLQRRAVLVRFDGEGNLDGPIPLRLPEGVISDTIAATDDGMVLLFGYYNDTTAPPELKGKSYVAVLDPSGAVRQELHVSVPGLDMAKLAAGEGPSPAVCLGDDGNFYLAATNQILVVSLGGDLLRRIPFENPYPNSRVDRLQVSGSLILVTLAHADKEGFLDLRYLTLLNPSGGTVGYYAPPEEGAGLAVCFTPKQGLTLLKWENQQLKILTAPLD